MFVCLHHNNMPKRQGFCPMKYYTPVIKLSFMNRKTRNSRNIYTFCSYLSQKTTASKYVSRSSIMITIWSLFLCVPYQDSFIYHLQTTGAVPKTTIIMVISHDHDNSHCGIISLHAVTSAISITIFIMTSYHDFYFSSW